MRLPIYSSAKEERWNSANHSVLWGWKRDEEAYQRVILFKGTIDRAADGSIQLEDWFFYYRNRCNPEDAQIIKSYFETEEILCNIGFPSCSLDKKSGLQIVEIQGGADRNNSRTILRRLLNRRKRKNIPRGEFPSLCKNVFDFEAHRPIAFYVGSGLSYEAGLMTLAEVHERFGVDNISKKCFTFGLDDPIPQALNNSVKKTFAEFVSLHVIAAEKEPSKSHKAIAKIMSGSIAVRLLTDNVDNLFNQLNVEFIRTRGIGVFNDPYKVLFDRNEKTLD